MGSMLQAVCKCGYESDLMIVGGGMLNYRNVCKVPYYCNNCKHVRTTNILKSSQGNNEEVTVKETTKCTKCRRKVQYYGEIKNTDEIFEMSIFNWSLGDEETYLLNNRLYYCPKCQQVKLKFFDVGCWD